MSNKSKAKLILDIMVEQDGLDVPAMMQRKLEDRIEKALDATEKSLHHKIEVRLLEQLDKLEASQLSLSNKAKSMSDSLLE